MLRTKKRPVLHRQEAVHMRIISALSCVPFGSKRAKLERASLSHRLSTLKS